MTKRSTVFLFATVALLPFASQATFECRGPTTVKCVRTTCVNRQDANPDGTYPEDCFDEDCKDGNWLNGECKYTLTCDTNYLVCDDVEDIVTFDENAGCSDCGSTSNDSHPVWYSVLLPMVVGTIRLMM
jgi:hypothetical protein